MLCSDLLLCSVLALVSVAAAAIDFDVPRFPATQHVFSPDEGTKRNGFPLGNESTYRIVKPVKTVAVIGAGASGLIAGRELLDHGFTVRLFERDHLPGGVWHYTTESAAAPFYNESDVLLQDYIPTLPPTNVTLPFVDYSKDYASERRIHRAPKQVWRDLHSNAPSPNQQITEWPWPTAQPWKSSQWALGRYLRSYAAFFGLAADEDYGGEGRKEVASYNTRVEHAEKLQGSDKWTLTLKRVTRHDETSAKIELWKEEFDAVLVASGRYNAPKIPRIPGLAAWAEKWPSHVFHSRSYRAPEGWANKTLLVVGVSISASEISREVAPFVDKLYQSVRELPKNNDSQTFPSFTRKYQLRRLPEKAEVVPEIERLEVPGEGEDISKGKVVLKNGTVLTGIDGIILGTGYRYTFPFLPQYHNASLGTNITETRVAPLVTDGTHIRSLFLDTFYIPDPTLAFININRLVGDFTWGAYQALAISKYWKGRIEIPSQEEQWKLHWERVRERGGYTKTFQFYGGQAPAAYRYIIGWLNSAAHKYGGKQVDRLPS
ncbi:hypothetical protein PLICRDRAFT_105338 [Plicaturopsis crispa FD-325 SS-3]|nr:hypothetical protein PLICRDRAFT_105338 [Plicaturopsis crispa FD-325 SS-3]